jgi:hypothetical protein
MDASEPGWAKPTDGYTDGYISELSASFEIHPAKAALIVADMQYATGSRKAGLGKRLTEEGRPDTLARQRFDRIEEEKEMALSSKISDGLKFLIVLWPRR